jgi:hypothetical protein
MEVLTNNHERQFKYGYEVPGSVLADFDHLNEDEQADGWIHYRNTWYHISDFMRCPNSLNMREWHGYSSDSFFSGVVIKLSDDCETYRIGTYLS